VLYEFRQSIRLQTWLNTKDTGRGFLLRQGQAALRALDDDLASGALLTITADWAEVISRADKLSSARTPGAGHRAFDILHVATALHLGARQFLSFDEKQRLLAKREGLLPRPA
jgi:predicted nucleic acid-binding protein